MERVEGVEALNRVGYDAPNPMRRYLRVKPMSTPQKHRHIEIGLSFADIPVVAGRWSLSTNTAKSKQGGEEARRLPIYILPSYPIPGCIYSTLLHSTLLHSLHRLTLTNFSSLPSHPSGSSSARRCCVFVILPRNFKSKSLSLPSRLPG